MAADRIVTQQKVWISAKIFTCGRDGGCSICSRLGILLSFLPCSSRCKPEAQEDKELNGGYDAYRPIIRIGSHDEDKM